LTYATIANEIEARVTDICNHARKVRSLAKNTLGSTLTGSFLGFVGILEVCGDLAPPNILHQDFEVSNKHHVIYYFKVYMNIKYQVQFSLLVPLELLV
jgi:hypothetical protein